MSSSLGTNHSNGSYKANGPPNNSSSGAHPAQNGNNGGQCSPAPSQATANGTSQRINGSTIVSYTKLLSQNGNFGDHFWPVNNGSRNGNNIAGSETWSRAVTGTKANRGAGNEEGDSRAGNAAGVN